MATLNAIVGIKLTAIAVIATMISDPASGCSDKYDENTCTAAKEMNLCKTRRGYSWTFCKKTCELCEVGCTDFSTCCSRFGKEQECSKNPDWMNNECPKKCGICEGLSGWSIALLGGFYAFAGEGTTGECELQGLLIELVKKYVEETETDPVSYDEGEPYSASALIEMIAEGKSNIAVSPFSIAEYWSTYRQRQQMVDFTEPIYEDEIMGMIFQAGSCGVRRLEQLAVSDFKWCLIEGGVVDAYLKSKSGDVYSAIRKGAEYVADYEEGLSKARSGKFVYLEEYLFAKALVLNYCDIETGPLKDEVIENYAFAVAKGFKGLDDLNKSIKKNRPMMKKLIKGYLTQDCEDDK